MSGEQELKRIINQYTKKWCKKSRQELRVADYERFAKDTEELFQMVLSRIQDETEHLYPLVREVTGGSKTVA
jgi:glutathionylspermidine synthase